MCCNKMFSTNWACSFDNSALLPQIFLQDTCPRELHDICKYMSSRFSESFDDITLTGAVLFKHQPFLLLYVSRLRAQHVVTD